MIYLSLTGANWIEYNLYNNEILTEQAKITIFRGFGVDGWLNVFLCFITGQDNDCAGKGAGGNSRIGYR